MDYRPGALPGTRLSSAVALQLREEANTGRPGTNDAAGGAEHRETDWRLARVAASQGPRSCRGRNGLTLPLRPVEDVPNRACRVLGLLHIVRINVVRVLLFFVAAHIHLPV